MWSGLSGHLARGGRLGVGDAVGSAVPPAVGFGPEWPRFIQRSPGRSTFGPQPFDRGHGNRRRGHGRHDGSLFRVARQARLGVLPAVSGQGHADAVRADHERRQADGGIVGRYDVLGFPVPAGVSVALSELLGQCPLSVEAQADSERLASGRRSSPLADLVLQRDFTMRLTSGVAWS